MDARSATKLLSVLQRIFQAQARAAMAQVKLDRPPPDMTPWVDSMVEACKPIILALRQQGMVQAAARIAAKRRGVSQAVEMPIAPAPAVSALPSAPNGVRTVRVGNEAAFGPRKGLGLFLKGRRRVICKAKTPELSFDFDLFRPEVIEAANAATYEFCRETMLTATTDLTTALAQLHELMRQGLPRGEAIELLAKNVRTIFADPMRAFRIATTETSRAVHGGQMAAAVEAGVQRHSWLASADACEHCLELDGKTVEIGQPFFVNPKGGPYAVVIHPPLHPHCFCTTTEEI